MEIEILRPVKINVATIDVWLPVRYKEEDIPNDFPLRNGDEWEATIEIETGKIRGWPQGKTGKMFMKVCDGGIYTIRDDKDNEIVKTNEYVPSFIPNDCGDYVDFEINENGIIAKWNMRELEDFIRNNLEDDRS